MIPSTSHKENLIQQIADAHLYNGWFTEKNVRYSIQSLADMLHKESLESWLSKYKLKDNNNPKTIGVIMAGNIPIVGFHDFVCVLLSGNKVKARLSSQDNKLLPIIANILIELEPDFKNLIEFAENQLIGADAYIATGSDNTSRYFEYYFGKYPHIIRKNRNSVAVINGTETEQDLKNLSDDIFLYYGLGCRNVTKLYIKKGFEVTRLFEAFNHYKEIINHNKYVNNYEYYKAIYLVNQEQHLDNGFLILKEEKAIASPVATVFYEYYNDIKQVNQSLELEKEKIQCIVSKSPEIKTKVEFGKSQKPQIDEYADNIDTMEFLLNL